MPTRDILAAHPRWQPLTAEQTAGAPYAGIASLRVHIAGPSGKQQSFVGTGWFVSPSKVVTAAHVTDIQEAWNSVPGALTWHIEVIPGCSGGQRPFKESWVARVERHPGWDGQHGTAHDIAVLIVSPPLSTIPTLLPGPAATSRPQPYPVTVAGYPHHGFGGETLVRGLGNVLAHEGPLLFYDIDVENGHSGSPILDGDLSSARPMVVGIHSGGQGLGTTALARSLNAGLALTSELVDWIDFVKS